jgi:hypothetical protein
MSLDVYLYEVRGSNRLYFIEEDVTGPQLIEVTDFKEWKQRFGDAPPPNIPVVREVFTENITHNLTGMAGKVDLYKALWRPEELGIIRGRDLVPLLEEGLEKLLRNPEKFQALNPENGWGSYEGLVRFVRRYLAACKDHPNARVYACR